MVSFRLAIGISLAMGHASIMLLAATALLASCFFQPVAWRKRQPNAF
jgi:hypothetical protein